MSEKISLPNSLSIPGAKIRETPQRNITAQRGGPTGSIASSAPAGARSAQMKTDYGLGSDPPFNQLTITQKQKIESGALSDVPGENSVPTIAHGFTKAAASRKDFKENSFANHPGNRASRLP